MTMMAAASLGSARPIALSASLRRFLSSRNASSRLLIGAASAYSVSSLTVHVSHCQGRGNNKKDDDSEATSILPRDNDGNIDWNKALSQVKEKATPGQGGDIWHALAVSAGDTLQAGIDSGIPTQLSYGFISGYCSGYALKKVGRTAAVVFGLGFMSLQTLSYYGYVKVDHGQIRKDVESLLDLNQDGKVDRSDGELAYDKLMSVLQFNLPGGSGFAAGFVGGIRSG
jgi:uncharacterized membrane protein (Fun14 family)